tara:strand:+ start:7115 stop:7423 length:309 start_codon:yes stop_codon:yes gene_type:complete
MMTANQLYKTSGSDLAFKEWLKREQLKGNLNVEEKKEFLNAGGNPRQVPTDAELLAEAEEALQVQLAQSAEESKAKFRRGILVGILVGVAGKVIFDKFYKKA